MARPFKEGLDYSEWDLSVLDCDAKIDALLEAQGIGAFTVYFYLVNKAYATHGYYFDWDFSCCATTARRLGKGASAAYVQGCVEKCLQVGLFDRGMLESHGILTSERIQKGYWKVAKNRKSPCVHREYWLLGDDESPAKNAENDEGLVSYTPKPSYEAPKPSYEAPKSPKSRVEESRVTLYTRGAHQNVNITDEQYAALCKLISDTDAYIDMFSAKMHERGYRYPDHYKAILEWWSRDKATWGKAQSKPTKTKGKKDPASGSFTVGDFFARAVDHKILDYKGDKK